MNGRLEPVGLVSSDDATVDHFESPELAISQKIQDLINSREVKFVWIDDASGSSVLNDIESLSYHDSGVTSIFHNAERPYLFCLYGEKVSKEQLGRMETAVTAFQQEYYGRGRAGRRPDMRRRKDTLKMLDQPGRVKEKAANVMTTPNIASSQSYVSRVRKESK
jgi:hypothetical protein